jgi:long-chain fatty acid transport protein
MKNLPRSLFIALGLTSLAGVASANSFNINEHDARVTGRAGAAVASDDDASSIVFNPAGLGLVTGTEIVLGGTLYIAEGAYENPTTPKVRTDSPPQPVPSVYVASRVHDMIAVGVGLHFPFGLAVSYPDGHPQATVAQDSNLRTAFISPTIGINLYKQVPGLSIGGGLDIVPASVELKRAVVFGDAQGTVDLAADTVGIGWRAGIMYHPPAAKGLKLGVMYRGEVPLDFKGQADFDIVDPYRSQLPPDGDASTTINLPRSVWGGVAYGMHGLELEVDAVWINWAKTFTKDAARGADATSLSLALPGGQTSNVPEDYNNTVTWRVGLDYSVPGYKFPMNVRAGFLYDPTPIPTTTQTAQLPDVDRVAWTFGAGLQATDEIGVNFGVLWIPRKTRESSSDPAAPIFHGTYSVDAVVLSVGLNGKFGAKTKPATSGNPTVARKD